MTLVLLVLFASAAAMAEEPGPVLNAALFQQLDLDKDGNVSAAEFKRWQASQRSRQHHMKKGIKPPAHKPPANEVQTNKAPAKKDAAKKDAAKKDPARKAMTKKQPTEKTPAARRGGRGVHRPRSVRGISFYSPYLPNEVVDVYGGTIYVVCDSDAIPDPSDCDPDGDGEPDADEAVLTIWARIYGPNATLPGSGSDPEQNGAQQLEDLGGYQDYVPAAAYSKVEPLPQLTLFVWEKVEYLFEGEPVEGCPPQISTSTLTIYGHDAD